MEKQDIVENVLGVLASYNRRMYDYGKNYRHYGTKHNLRQDQIHLISRIGRNPNCGIHFLAQETGAGVPTVSLRVNRLEKMGLICKQRSTASQREVEVNLTEEGRQAYRYHEELDDAYFSHANGDLMQYTEEELEVILKFLNMLMDWKTGC